MSSASPGMAVTGEALQSQLKQGTGIHLIVPEFAAMKHLPPPGLWHMGRPPPNWSGRRCDPSKAAQ